MDRVDALLTEYRRQLALPWRADLSGAERIWMAVYPPELERRVRGRLGDFELATLEAGHSWLLHDVTSSFSQWLASQEYANAYLRIPAKAISQSGVFDHPRPEAAERPTLGRGSPPDDHLLSGGCG